MVWDMRGAIPKRSAADARNINALKLQMFTGEGMFICLAARLKRTIFHEILKNRISELVTRVTSIRLNRSHAQ